MLVNLGKSKLYLYIPHNYILRHLSHSIHFFIPIFWFFLGGIASIIYSSIHLNWKEINFLNWAFKNLMKYCILCSLSGQFLAMAFLSLHSTNLLINWNLFRGIIDYCFVSNCEHWASQQKTWKTKWWWTDLILPPLYWVENLIINLICK